MINPYLEKLSLVSCKLDDEQILQLSDSKKLVQLTHLDLSDNLIERNFTVITKILKEKCDFLQEFMLGGNKGLKKVQNF